MRLCCMLDIRGGGYSRANALHRRFLRARKFDVEGAWAQFKDTEDWRKENKIESLYANIGVDSYEAARRMVCSVLKVPSAPSSRW